MFKFQRENIQRNIVLEATEIANTAVRRSLLDDVVNAYFQDRLADITGQSIAVLKQGWRPFKPNMISPSGMGVYLEVSDPLVQQLMIEENLYDTAYDIAMESFVETIRHSPEFFTMLLTDLLIEEKPFYKVKDQ